MPWTGKRCLTAYKAGSRCDRCVTAKRAENQRRPTTQTERRPVVRAPKAPKAPKAPRGTVLARGPQPVRVPDRPVRAPAPARRLSPGLLATYGFGDAVTGTQGPRRASGKVTVRAGQDVKKMRWPADQRPSMRCGRCGVERQLIHRGETLTCGGCGGELRWVGWTPVEVKPAPVISYALPGPAPGTTTPAAKKAWESGASGWSSPTRPQGGLVKALLAAYRAG